MRVGDIMTQEVISVTPETTIVAAANLMLKERISGLPVISTSHVLVGIVTEGDFLRRAEVGTERKRPHWLEFILGSGPAARDYVHSHAKLVVDIMTREVAVADEDMPLDDAVDLMERKHVKRLPVLRDGRVVGIITRANLLHALAANPPRGAASTDDQAIRQGLTRELEGKSWSVRQFHFMVKDGVVDLWGFISDERQRDAIRVAAENVPGVTQVRDHLCWVEPYTGMVVAAGVDDRKAILH